MHSYGSVSAVTRGERGSSVEGNRRTESYLPELAGNRLASQEGQGVPYQGTVDREERARPIRGEADDRRVAGKRSQ